VNELPLRIAPGADLRRALEQAVRGDDARPAFVVCGIGSLAGATLRLAGAPAETALAGEFEILSLAGTVTADGAHLHMAVADARGRVLGGHVGYGNAIRTTAEVLLVRLSGWALSREPDAATGCRELVVRPAAE
jgi:predicted DNA-binding protein with PD1-like motif